MAWRTLNLPGLSTAPSVLESESRVEARTRFSLRVLLLFAYERVLWADAGARVLYLVVRRWWLFREEIVIPFKQVEYLRYGYGERTIDVGAYFIGQAPGEPTQAGPVNAIDWFTVSVKLKDRERPLLLFRCVGEGGLLTEFAAIAVPYSLGGLLLRTVLVEGDEELISRQLARALARILGVAISSPLEQSVAEGLAGGWVPCPNCGRQIGKHVTRCLYCTTRIAGTGEGLSR